MKRRLLAVLIALFAFASAGQSFAEGLGGDYVDFDPQATADQVSAPLFVVIAYSTIWLFVLVFALLIWRRQGAISGQLAQLQGRLEAQGHEPPGGSG